MTNFTNPALSFACAAGIAEALLARSPIPAASGNAPSTTAADYLATMNVANAIALELDGQLGAGFDTQLASNATPGVSVALSGLAAGTASLAPVVKPNAMQSIARAFFFQRATTDTTPADYLTIAQAIKAAYQEWVTVVYANAS